jgi:outer membrane cobalamin receptor
MGDSNTIVTGATGEHQKGEVHAPSANYLPSNVPFVWYYLPAIQKIPDNLVMDKETRNFWAVFLEDVWDITKDLRLTLGARYDHYSDFGDHLSPRAGLTWEYMKGYDVKLLYGNAFLAPSFNEVYEPSNGNPGLDPETIDTYEISFGAEFTDNFESRMTFYHREGKDLITQLSSTIPFIYVNEGSPRDQGLELEMRYDFGRGTYLAGNYNYQDWKTGNKAKYHYRKIMANIRLSRYLNFYADCQLKSKSERALEDTRDDLSGYGIVNATLMAKNFLKGYENLELRGSVYNLLNKQYKYYTSPEIPNDMPAPGINFLLEMKYSF